jgi:fibronectin type 3 domain-containing protein
MTTSPGAEPITPTISGVTGTSALVTNLTPGTRYYFTVKTIAPTGISAASNETSAIPVAPAPATNLSAVAGPAAVQLSWSASSNGTSYNVYAGTSAGGEASSAVLTSITSTSAAVTGLTPGTKYYFVVKAVTNGAPSAASNEAAATPLVTAPPASFTATAAIGGAAFSWIDSPGASSYQIYIGATAGAESSTPFQSGLAGSAGNISTLNAATTYFAVLRSVANGVASGPSNEVTFTTLSFPAPQIVTLAKAVGQITVSWDASPGATGYSVFIGTAAGAEGAAPAMTVPGLQAIFTGLSDDSTYYFYVQANTGIGPSARSPEVSSSPNAPPGPTNLAATGGNAEITLTWSASSGATTYDVYQGATTGGEAPAPVQTGISGLSTEISGLAAGTQYYFVVRAETAQGTSAASNEASAAPVAAATSTSHSGGGAIDRWSIMCLTALLLAGMRPKRRRSRA